AATHGNAAISESLLASDAIVCASGFGDTRSKDDMTLQGVTLTDSGALAVGFARRRRTNDGGRRKPVAIYNSAGRWTRTYAGSPGDEDGLVAVDSGFDGRAWAVGFTTIDEQVMPLGMRWDGSTWKATRPGRRGSLDAMFTDVAVIGRGAEPLAVGYRMTANGKRLPIAARKSGKRWRYLNPGTGPRESVSLTGVAPDLKGGIWAVGQGGPGTEIGPVIYRRRDSLWRRQKVPRFKGEAVLTDVVATSRNDAWAVGYHRNKGRSRPLILRYDGSNWQRAEAPSFDSNEVILTAVSAAPEGGTWVVGAAWNAGLRDYEAVAAWWDGQAWNEVSGTAGGNELQDVIGALDADGWAVGRAGRQARATRVCTPPQTGIFGGSEPTQPRGPGGTADRPTASSSDSDGAAQPATASASDTEPAEAVAEAAAATEVVLAMKNKKNNRKSRRKRRRAIKPLPRVRADARLVARDMAREAGIAGTVSTYGAVVADFDGDGRDDLYLGRHGGRARLALNEDGRFVNSAAMRFPAIDRHGCAAADIDGSGLPDLYCTVGGKRGSGLKANELWIDPGGEAPYDAAPERGLSDPTGRGRTAEFLAVRKSDKASLIVTNAPTRVDGLPSPSRLFRSDGRGDFTARARTGFAARLGALSSQSADFGRDGREDLLLVTGGQQAPQREGTRLYRNTRRGLVDVTRQMGIRSFAEVDAELVDLNADGKLDLVQLSPTRLRVSILRKGRFVKVYERSLTFGRAIASGDVNGDRKGDLYIVRSNGNRNPADVMLINRKNGRSFSSMAIPQVYSGNGDDAVAIDYDGNGRDDFLVLNGRNDRGPIQLIAFYKR
ncbi:MAG: FG-GAP repeat domain-containing protein, partial [Chloroflexota bacterium]